MVRQGEFLNKVALTVLDLTQERLIELSALQHRQTELMATLQRIMTRDVGASLLGSGEEWREMMKQEARAMHEVNESRFQFLNSLCYTVVDHAGIQVDMESQEYMEEGEHLRQRVEEAQRMLKKPATGESIAEDSANVDKMSAGQDPLTATVANEATTSANVTTTATNVASTSAKVTTVGSTSADVVEVAVPSANDENGPVMHAEDVTTSADDAEGETASADESEDSTDEGNTGKASADEDASDMDVNDSADEDIRSKWSQRIPRSMCRC